MHKLLITLLLLLTSSLSFSHSDHSDGPINENKAFVIAKSVTHQFTQNDPGLGFGLLSESWRQLESSDYKMYKKGAGYYIVSVTNNLEKRSLYVLMAENGEVYDANFTGEFKGIK